MTARLVDPTKTFDCCVCWVSETTSWAALSGQGWRSHYAGEDLDVITLCGACSDHMADRREAHQKAREEEQRA